MTCRRCHRVAGMIRGGQLCVDCSRAFAASLSDWMRDALDTYWSRRLSLGLRRDWT